MTDTVTLEPQTEAQAIASARAGYEGRKARASAPAAAPASPAEVTPAADPLADPAPAPGSAPAQPEAQEPNPQAEAAAPTPAPQPAITEELRALKAKVHEMAASGADAATVRKMHGDIGEITRMVKQLTAANAPAAEDKVAAAMARVTKAAEEYPEIGGPVLEALKELRQLIPQVTEAPKEPQNEPTPAPAAPSVDLAAERTRAAQQAAIDALNEMHPDRLTLKDDPAFKAWFAKWKTPEYREKVQSSWNPVLVSQPFSEFKAWREGQKRRQDRLDAAVQPQGTPQQPSATPTTDADAAKRGYQRYAAKRL